MSADIWFKGDIQNALRAAAHAGMETTRRLDNEDYGLGYFAALITLALQFGVEPERVVDVKCLTSGK